MPVLASIVDWDVMGELVLAGIVGGIGASAVFSLSVYGVARGNDLRRDGNGAVATLLYGLALLAFLVFLGAIAWSISVIADK